jgi:hypothetical protein
MNRQLSSARGLTRTAALIALVGAIALVMIPVAIEGNTSNGLTSSIDVSTRGPLSVSGPNNTVWLFIYVSNRNTLTSATDGQFNARDTLHNAFVPTSVDETIFVDGEQDGGVITWTPPPYPTPAGLPGYAKRWTETVQCPSTGPPCNEVRSPAVVPGEKTAVLFVGWGHAAGELNGKYVFKFTVHGTLNGEPVDVSANSRPITMTD